YVEGWNEPLRISEVNGADPVRSGVLPEPFNGAAVSGYDMSQAAPHIHLITGRLPQDTPPGQMPEVLVTNQMQEGDTQANVGIGDTITLAPEYNQALRVMACVAGIWHPKDKQDQFWNGRSFEYTPPPTRDVASPAVWPLVFTQNGFLSALNFGN